MKEESKSIYDILQRIMNGIDAHIMKIKTKKQYDDKYYANRLVWVKSKKTIGLCCSSCDGKCSVVYFGGFNVFWDKNLIALSPKIPYWLVKLIAY